MRIALKEAHAKRRVDKRRVLEVLFRLPLKDPSSADLDRWADIFCMRRDQSNSYQRDFQELDRAALELAGLHRRIVELKHHIDQLSSETRWILDSDLRQLEDDLTPPPLDQFGADLFLRLEHAEGELTNLQKATAPWAYQAARGKGRGGRPKALTAESVADSALNCYRALIGVEVGTNLKGNPTDGAFADFLGELFGVFGIKASSSSQAVTAVKRQRSAAAQ